MTHFQSWKWATCALAMQYFHFAYKPLYLLLRNFKAKDWFACALDNAFV